MIHELTNWLSQNKIDYEYNVDLKNKTLIKRGGNAEYFITPKNVQILQLLCSFLYSKGILFEIIGNTSNLYFLNSCNPIVVISTIKCNVVEETTDYLICDCGVSVSKLSKQAIQKGIKGFEYLTTLPGTVGASIYNNSSCHSCSIVSLLEKIEFLNINNELIILYPDELLIENRSSALKRKEIKGVILKAYLKKGFEDSLILIKKAKNNELNRKLTLEGPSKNLGCTISKLFKYGKMPLFYRLILGIYNRINILCGMDQYKRIEKSNRLILIISGYKSLLPYVSKKLISCFIWKDENADFAFDKYKEFMRKIYKTDELEIEVKC